MSAVLLVASFLPGASQAQTRALAFSFGAGPAFNDHRNTFLGTQGFSAFVRVTSLRGPFLLDVSYVNVPAAPVVNAPCPSFATSCGSGFTGPVSALTLSPAVQTVETKSIAEMLYRIGPTVSWLPDRQPGTTAAALGARAGVSLVFKFGRGPQVVASADYFLMFRGGTAPQWFVPVAFGLQL